MKFAFLDPELVSEKEESEKVRTFESFKECYGAILASEYGMPYASAQLRADTISEFQQTQTNTGRGMEFQQGVALVDYFTPRYKCAGI